MLFNKEHHTFRLLYHFEKKIYTPFPENTRGHLYYCTPSQDRPRLSGSIRFRVLPSTSDHYKGFADGTDLLRPDGRPWELPLYNVIHSAGYEPLVKKLLNENLLDTDLRDTVAKLPRFNLRKSSDVLYTLSDPFTLPLDRKKRITVMTEDHLLNFRFYPLILQQLGRYPFTGILLSNDSPM